LVVSRVGSVGLVDLASRLSPRDQAIIDAVARLRLLSTRQLERLLFAEITHPGTRARLARRVLARLVALGILGRLERRVGGVRAGAAGHVYFTAAAGQRLLAFWRGEGLRRTRNPYEPSSAFVRHTLAVAELYVQLIEADREGAAGLLEFQGEPGCWCPFIGHAGAPLVLKPDARVRLAVAAGEEEHAFLEVDCGTEGRTALTRKCRAYVAYWRSGAERDVFPRVVWVTTNEQRVNLLGEVCASMPAETWKLFLVSTPARVLTVLTGNLPVAGGVL
jgi:hypothetical protein